MQGRVAPTPVPSRFFSETGVPFSLANRIDFSCSVMYAIPENINIRRLYAHRYQCAR